MSGDSKDTRYADFKSLVRILDLPQCFHSIFSLILPVWHAVIEQYTCVMWEHTQELTPLSILGQMNKQNKPTSTQLVSQ